jgi:hypothetical protein
VTTYCYILLRIVTYCYACLGGVQASVTPSETSSETLSETPSETSRIGIYDGPSETQSETAVYDVTRHRKPAHPAGRSQCPHYLPTLLGAHSARITCALPIQPTSNRNLVNVSLG